MSTDAFAAALGKGAAMLRPRWRDALRTGAIFGLVEAATPLLGWSLGSMAQPWIEAWDHWVAFALLSGLGLHLVWKADRKSVAQGRSGAFGGRRCRGRNRHRAT